METLWSMSTTIREAERIIGFVKTAMEIEGEVWDRRTQEKFQILLIKNRQYLNDPTNTQSFSRLSATQIAMLKEITMEMTYEDAESIFYTKEYEDPPMRGRQSMSPLIKLGLVYISEQDRKVIITDVGKKLINGDIEFNDFMSEALLKFQYPNPCERGFQTWNTKPFINTLRLIKKVNQICHDREMKEKGISKIEFGIFALSLKRYDDIDDVAEKIVKFRIEYEEISDDTDKEIFKINYINEYLVDFKNPVKNVKEYTDNMIRYLRLTKYIYIRGKYQNMYIDLEPRRMIEINSILDSDSGMAKEFDVASWQKYMGTYGTYDLPFETNEKLIEIEKNIENEIHYIEKKLGIPQTNVNLSNEKEELKNIINLRRNYRTKLQNLEIRLDYHNDVGKIDEAIEALQYILNRNSSKLAKRFSIELEKWANVALNIINDSKLIKPNSPVGDDNEPIYTAPNGMPDIECYYDSFNSICEVTMLTSRDQWFNEGQPVMRHLREFENKNENKPNYCLFIAPSIHVDTINTFYMSVKYEYDGKKQKIIPITINQLIDILRCIKLITMKGLNFSHLKMMELYDVCTNIGDVSSATEWKEYIKNEIISWTNTLVL